MVQRRTVEPDARVQIPTCITVIYCYTENHLKTQWFRITVLFSYSFQHGCSSVQAGAD